MTPLHAAALARLAGVSLSASDLGHALRVGGRRVGRVRAWGVLRCLERRGLVEPGPLRVGDSDQPERRWRLTAAGRRWAPPCGRCPTCGR